MYGSDLELGVDVKLNLDDSQLAEIFDDFDKEAKKALSDVNALEKAIERVQKVQEGTLDYDALTDVEKQVYQLKTLKDAESDWYKAFDTHNKDKIKALKEQYGSWGELRGIIKEVEADWLKIDPSSLDNLSTAMRNFRNSTTGSEEGIENIKEDLDKLGQVATEGLGKLKNQVSSSLEGTDITEPLVKAAKENFPAALNELAQLAISKLGSSGIGGAVIKLAGSFASLIPVVGQVIAVVMALYAAFKLIFGDSIKKGFANIKQDITDVINGVSGEDARKRLDNNALLGFAETLQKVSTSIKKFRLDVEKSISGTNSTIEALDMNIQSLSIKLLQLIPKMSKLYTTIEGYPKLFSTLKSAFTSFTSSVASLTSTLSGKVKDALDIDLTKNFGAIDTITETVFGNASREIEEFTNTAVTNLGMTSTAAKEMLNTFAVGFTSLGLSSASVTSFSKNLTQLSADVASAFGTDSTDVANKFYKAIIKGSRDSVQAMREFGVALDADTMQAFATSQGYKTLYKDMSDAQRAALRYEKTLTSLSGIQGAFAANANTFVGQLKILKTNFSELGNYLSKIMQVVLLPMVKVLNTIVSSITAAVKAFAGILGIDFGGVSAKTVTDLGGMSEAASDLADSENSAASGINKAAKAAKNALAPFHKLNVLQSKNTSGGTGSDIGAIVGGLQNSVEGAIPSLKDMLNNFMKWFKNFDIVGALKKLTDGINDWLDKAIVAVKNFFNKLQPWVKLVADIFNYLVENIKGLKIGQLIGEVFGGAFKTLNTLLDNIHWGSFGIFVADIVNGVARVKSAFMELGGVIGGFVNAKNKFQLSFWTEADVSDWANSLTLAMKKAMDKIDLSLAYAAAFAKISKLSQFFTDLMNGFVNSFVPEKIGQYLSEKFIAIGNWFASDGYKDLLEACTKIWVQFWNAFSASMDAEQENGLSTWGNLKAGILGGITTALDGLTVDDFLKTVYHVFDILIDAVQTVIDKFGKDSPITKMMQGFIENTFGVDFNMFFDLEDGLDMARSAIDDLGESLYGLSGIISSDDVAWQHYLQTHKDIAEAIEKEGLSVDEAKKKYAGYKDEWEALDPEIKKGAENQALLNTELDKTTASLTGLDLHKVAEGLAYNGETAASLAERLDEVKDKQKELNTQLEVGAAQAKNVKDIEVQVNQERVAELENYLAKYIETNGTIRQLTDEEIDALNRYRNASSEIVRSNIKNRTDEIASTEEHKAFMLQYYDAIDEAIIANEAKNNSSTETYLANQEKMRTESETTKNDLVEDQRAITESMDTTKASAEPYGTETGESYKTGLDSVDAGKTFIDRVLENLTDPEQIAAVKAVGNEMGLNVGDDLGKGINTGIEDSKISETLVSESENATTAAVDTINTAVDGLTTDLASKTDAIVTDVDDKNKTIETNTTTLIDTLFQYISDKINTDLKPALEELKTLIEETFIDSVENIETTWDKISSTIENTANKMADALDKAADSAERLIDKLKEAASAQKEYNSAKNSSSSNNRGYPSSIQGYANGGVFLPNRPQLAILGDNRSQTEYALTTGHLQQIADMMANTIGSIATGSDQPITIPIYLGNELIDQRVITAGQMHNYRSNGR